MRNICDKSPLAAVCGTFTARTKQGQKSPMVPSKGPVMDCKMVLAQIASTVANELC